MNVLVPSSAAGDPNIKQYLMTNSTVSGASFQVQWSNVDQGPSAPQQYDFSFVDNEIQPWISAGKKVNLIVWANADSSNNTCTNGGQNNTGNCAIPAYVWTGLGPANFTMCTPNNAAGPQQIPNYLSVSGFQVPYQNFMAAVISHYSSNTGVGYRDGDIYASHDGNVYRHTDDGWQQHSSDGWQNAQRENDRSFSQQRANLDSQRSSRDLGQQRFQGRQNSGGFHRAGGGGRGRR